VQSLGVRNIAALDAVLAAGMHPLLAVYEGNDRFAPSVSSIVQQVVAPAGDGPTVTSLKRYGYHAQPTVLVLSFSEALDPATAEDVANYQIVTIDGPGRGGARAGHRTAVSQAVYDPGTQTVTLYPAERLDVHNFYRLTVVGTGQSGVSDLSGRLLDGLGNGAPGSNYQAVISRAALAGASNAVVTSARRGVGLTGHLHL
jgi:hypothetical protein